MKKDMFRRVEPKGNFKGIQIDKIPEKDRIEIAKRFWECVKHFYSDPKNAKEFEEWLKKKNETKQS